MNSCGKSFHIYKAVFNLLGNNGRFWRVFLTASHGDVVTGVHFGLFVHKVKLCVRLKYQPGYFLCQNFEKCTFKFK